MTPKTIEIPCWERRFVTGEEMRALLDLKRPQWEKFCLDNATRVKPNFYGKYDRTVVEQVFAKQ